MNKTRKSELLATGAIAFIYGLFVFVYQLFVTSNSFLWMVVLNPLLGFYSYLSNTDMALVQTLSVSGSSVPASTVGAGVVFFWLWPGLFLVAGGFMILVSRFG